MDPTLEIYSAGMDPVSEIEPIAIEIMKEVGICIEQKKPERFSRYAQMEFDFLITVGDGTPEQLNLPPVKAKRKMHLGFLNPFKSALDSGEIREACREIRDEIMVELDYFYTRIILKAMEREKEAGEASGRN